MDKQQTSDEPAFYFVIDEPDPLDDVDNRTFWDAFDDVFTHPEDLKLQQPVDDDFMGPMRDAMHIREYFRKAIERLGLEESDSVSRPQ